MGLALPTALSPSSVSAFKDCPQAFRFSYIDRLPEPPSAPASKGTLVHRALELLMLRAAGRPHDRRRAGRPRRPPGPSSPSHPEFAELELTEDEWAAFHADAELLVRRYFELEDPHVGAARSGSSSSSAPRSAG